MIDLHIHSTASDGIWTPKEIIQKALNKGLKAISITDHDTVRGVNQVLDTKRIEIISGIELSAWHEKTQLHILGYNFDTNNKSLLSKLEYLKKMRDTRADRIIQKLNNIGLKISKKDIEYEGVIARPNIARAMVKKNHVKSISEAFEKYLSKGKKAFVPKTLFSFKESVKIIEKAGGIPVLAHPGEIETKNVLNWLELSLQKGIQGIEVFHPSNNSKIRKTLIDFANKYDLFITGGSDCHGKHPKKELGIEKIPYKHFKRLKSI